MDRCHGTRCRVLGLASTRSRTWLWLFWGHIDQGLLFGTPEYLFALISENSCNFWVDAVKVICLAFTYIVKMAKRGK